MNGKKSCFQCKGRGYILRECVLSYTWKHGFKEPEYDEIYKSPCECVVNYNAKKAEGKC